MERKISKVMYSKYNVNDNRRRMVIGNKNGITIIDKPFNKVLEEVVEKEIPITKNVEDNPMDELFIWKAAFDKKRRGL